MKFSSKEDIEAPIDAVFEVLSDFETYEKAAVRRGIDVRRVDAGGPPRVGMAWLADFELRGKARNMRMELVEYDLPHTIRLDTDSQGLHGDMTLDLVALSPRRTRLAVALDLRPKTLPARLMIQSLRLAKGNLTKRFKLKVADYARLIEERHRTAG